MVKTLYEKLIFLHPELIPDLTWATSLDVKIQDNSDGKGPVIAQWNHKTVQRPTTR